MDAVKELADTAGIELPAPDPRAKAKAERASGLYEVMEAAAAWFIEQLDGLEGGPAREYLKKRRITEATRRKFGFGYAPDSRGKLRTALARFGVETLIEAGLLVAPEDKKEPYDRFRGRITFPIRDARGRCIGFSARIVGPGEPKYLNSPDTPLFDKGRTLFNLDKAAPASREAKRVIVVEGQMDVIALDQAGVSEAVAPLGTALTEGQLQKLWQLNDEPILCFDGDAAGLKAAVRACERALAVLAPGKTLVVATLPPGQDPDDLISDVGRNGFDEVLANAKPLSEFIWETELKAEPLDTPEARATFGRRLRDRARTIPDEDVRIQYLGFFNGRLSEIFERFRSGGGGERHHAFIKGLGIAPEMLAISKHGLDQAVIVRALLDGLRRYPNVIGELSEAVALVWIKTKRWAQVREAMLVAALETWPLDRETLDAKLKAEGLAPSLEGLRKTRDLAYTFLREQADPEQAQRDLAEVIDRVTAGASFDAAIRAAYRRAGSTDPDEWQDAFRELERLYGLQRASDEDLRNFSWRTVDSAQEA
jgi:DNA primase